MMGGDWNTDEGGASGFKDQGDKERRSLTMRIKVLALGVPIDANIRIKSDDLAPPETPRSARQGMQAHGIGGRGKR
jgi:hypothetical protein